MPGEDGFQYGGALPMGIIPIPMKSFIRMGFRSVQAQRPPRRSIPMRRVSQQQANRRRPVGYAEPAHRLLDMAVHRLGRDLKLATDLLRRPVPGGQVEALPLARGQPIQQERCSGRGHGAIP